MYARAYRLKKRACNSTPSKFKPSLKIVTVSTVSNEGKPANVTKYSINYSDLNFARYTRIYYSCMPSSLVYKPLDVSSSNCSLLQSWPFLACVLSTTERPV